MATQINQRPNAIFLSHSSKDKAGFVDHLFQWLERQAGLKVWFDRGLASGQISSNLDEAIDSCRAAVIVLSKSSVQSPWVVSECNRLQEEWARTREDFRIATIRLDDVDPPGLLKSYKHIDVRDGKLTASAAALLMESLYGGRDNALGQPVYISRGWKAPEKPASDRLCDVLKTFGLKLVCDWVDQPHYDANRVRSILDGTGGLVAILPHRGSGTTSSYVVREVAMARELGLPVLAFVQDGVVPRPEWFLDRAIAFDGSIAERPVEEASDMLAEPIESFVQSWKKPGSGEHVFVGHSLEDSIHEDFTAARRMLSRLTGLPVETGGLVTGSDAQRRIVQLIGEAEMCIIDITNSTYQGLPEKIDFAMNSCIEAGIAIGADKALYLTCRAPRRSPPFMFRNRQVWFYQDDLELMGNLRQIAALHRRMVL